MLTDIPFEDAPSGPRIGCGWDGRAGWRTLTWEDLAGAVGDTDPDGEVGRMRLRHWMSACSLLLGPLAVVRSRIVPLGLPRQHPAHPGPGWAREAVHGGVIEIGLGLRAIADDSPVIPLAPGAARCAEIETDAWWSPTRAHLETMAELAISRLQRDAKAVLRTIGGCEVLTLLGSAALRHHLALGDGTGMRAVAVPMRSRGWFDLARIDPPFVLAASGAIPLEERGLDRPLLVTVDDVVLAAAPADPSAAAARILIDLTTSPERLRDMLYR